MRHVETRQDKDMGLASMARDQTNCSKGRGARSPHLVSVSLSLGADDGASKDILIRPRSTGSAEVARLPVLRFLGRDSGCKVLPRPRSSSGAWDSASTGCTVSHSARQGKAKQSPCIIGLAGDRVDERRQTADQPFLFRGPPCVWGIVGCDSEGGQFGKSVSSCSPILSLSGLGGRFVFARTGRGFRWNGVDKEGAVACRGLSVKIEDAG